MGLSKAGSSTFLQHLDFGIGELVLSRTCYRDLPTQSPSSTQAPAAGIDPENQACP